MWGPIILFVVTSATINAGRTNGHRSSSSSNSEEILMDTSSPPDPAAMPLPEDDSSEDEHLRAWIDSIPDEFISEGEEPIEVDITPPEGQEFQPRGPIIDSTNQADVSSASTTDEFIAGIDNSQPSERAKFFALVKAKLDIRDAVAHPRPPRVHRPATADAGTQTYLSLSVQRFRSISSGPPPLRYTMATGSSLGPQARSGTATCFCTRATSTRQRTSGTGQSPQLAGLRTCEKSDPYPLVASAASYSC